MFFSTSIAAAVVASVSFVTAVPTASQNWKLETNALGYEVARFKPGFEPGSEDYSHRFGDIDFNSTSSLVTRDNARTTKPYVGKTRIPYGCNTDIGNYVFSRIHELCDEDRCDEGSTVSAEVEYPVSGKKQKANVVVAVSGFYPSGSKDHMIRAVQAMVPQNGVDYYDVISYGPIRGGHSLQDTTICEVVGSSNFFSVVVTNDADDSLVGNLDVSVTFDEGENGAICGTIATVAKEIAGAINGIAGALFGVVQAVSCK
ncbi:hypothetical protein CBER1_11544 [Cercospora berteroae]|uniref:Uncharacterized protein n=1 Tax=Cercospora berteroae TaxID=357750 RepID=A0A2S6BZD1_9PEZI|nr:hypothetical protein CBER1_11544 [Cercospora berteroae]